MKKGLLAFFYAASLVLVFLAASIVHVDAKSHETVFDSFTTESNYGKIDNGI